MATPNVTWTQPDPFASSYSDIIATVSKNPDANLYPSDPKWFQNGNKAFVWALQARHVLYWVNKAPSYENGQLISPSDTDGAYSAKTLESQNPALGAVHALTGIQQVTKYSGLAVGVATALGHSGVAALAAGTAAGTALSVATIALFGVGLAVLPVLMIYSHHAQAVALEHQNNAKAVDYANFYLNQIQRPLINGQITTQEFDTFAKQLMLDFARLNQGSYKRGNAAWTLRNELAIVLELYRRINKTVQDAYQQLAQMANKTPSISTAQKPAVTSIPQGDASLPALLVAGAAGGFLV